MSLKSKFIFGAILALISTTLMSVAINYMTDDLSRLNRRLWPLIFGLLTYIIRIIIAQKRSDEEINYQKLLNHFEIIDTQRKEQKKYQEETKTSMEKIKLLEQKIKVQDLEKQLEQ